MSADKKNLLERYGKEEENTLINNPNFLKPITIPTPIDIQGLYRKAIEVGLKNNTVTKSNKNGFDFYEIKEPIIYKNYGKNRTGKFILTKIDGDFRLFIVRENVKAVAVPFGEFIDENNKSPFDYIIENRPNNINRNSAFIHYHMRDNKHIEMTSYEKKRLTEYYALKSNSQKVGKIILSYLKTGKQTLDEVSNIWSGSGLNMYNFGAEIEAHADMFLNRTKLTEFLYNLRKLQKNGDKNDKFNEQYYGSLGMADMAIEDKGKLDKILMDKIWGQPNEEQKRMGAPYKGYSR